MGDSGERCSVDQRITEGKARERHARAGWIALEMTSRLDMGELMRTEGTMVGRGLGVKSAGRAGWSVTVRRGPCRAWVEEALDL